VHKSLKHISKLLFWRNTFAYYYILERNNRWQTLIIALVVTCSGCGDSGIGNKVSSLTGGKLHTDAMKSSITAALADSSHALWPKFTDSFYSRSQVQQLYKLSKGELLWLQSSGINEQAERLLKQLAVADSHGISGKFFSLDSLKYAAKQIESKGDQAAASFELKLSHAYLRLVGAMTHGIFPTDSVREEWYSAVDSNANVPQLAYNLIDKDSIAYACATLAPKQKEYRVLCKKLWELRAIQAKGGWQKFDMPSNDAYKLVEEANNKNLRKRLFVELGLPTDTISSSLDTALLQAITKFQYLHDIKITGKIDTTTYNKLQLTAQDKINTICNNLERMRWMQNSYASPYVYVNVPQMYLEYRLEDSTAFRMRVVVGRVSRPTPTLDAPMKNIVFNPPWSVPPTIMEEEIVPGVSKRGSSYLARRGLKAYLGGREVDASRINRSNYKMFTISQKPGLNSSLGVVKFNLPNRHAIYLHDTPHREDFVKQYRAFSSGCIRVHKPRDFAAFILNDSTYSRDNIDSIAKTRITKEVPLKQKLDVHIVYLTNGIDSAGNFMYLRDIYGQDKLMRGLWN
jgi:L,D-transpeptidase YcbB